MKTSIFSLLTTILLAALLAGGVQAQSSSDTVIQVFWITETTLSLNSIDQQPLAGSIVTADASSTVVAIQCTGSSVDTSVCGTAPITLTLGSTTWMATTTDGNLGLTLDCSIAQNTEFAVCTGEIDGPAQLFTDPLGASSSLSALLTASTASVTSTAFSGTIPSAGFTYMPVTITAGQDKLGSASGSASASGAQASSSSVGGDGNGAGSLNSNLRLTGLVAAALGMAVMVL